MNGFIEGERVELVRDVERYPHFIARAGSRGTVVHASPDFFSVRLDLRLDGAEPWDNEVCWYTDHHEPPWDDVRSLARKTWRRSNEITGSRA